MFSREPERTRMVRIARGSEGRLGSINPKIFYAVDSLSLTVKV